MRKEHLIGCVAGCILLVSLVLPVASTQAEVDAAWRGEYFNNPTLSGRADLIREDTVISFDWGDGLPASPQELGEAWTGDNFSVRWTKTEYFFDEVYAFAARSDDGVRMYINGELIIDEWHDNQFTWYSVEREMTAGEYKIVVEFYETIGRAAIQAGYYPLNPLPTPTDTPKYSPTPSPTSTSGGGGGGHVAKTSTPRPTSTPSLAGTPGKKATSVVVVPPEQVVEIVVEELDGKLFAWRGFPGLVPRRGGHEESHAYVKNYGSKVSFEAKWFFRPPESGFYDVFVFVPKVNERATGAATYQVYHNDQMSGQVAVDQKSFYDEWVQIGTFFFVPGKTQYVYMTNATGEDDGTREVLIDAVMFVYRP